MPVTATVKANISGGQTNVLDLGTGTFPFVLDYTLSLDAGTGANQIDRIFSDIRTLAASATEDLDLAGVLTDAYGAVITFARVKAIYVTALAANTNTVVVGAGTNPFVGPLAGTTPSVAVAPGGAYMVVRSDATGWPVTAATADILKVTNGGAGTSITYSIVILGCSV